MYELLQNSYKVTVWDLLLKYVDVHIKCMILYDFLFFCSHNGPLYIFNFSGGSTAHLHSLLLLC